MNREPNEGVCAQYEALLEDSIEGLLQGNEAESLAAHVNVCLSCRAALGEARESNRLLHLGEPTSDPGPAFTHMVMARIRTEMQQSQEKSLWRFVAAFARPFALSATVALGIMLAYSAYWVPNRVAVQQPDAHELISDPGAPPVTLDDTLIMLAENEHGK
jgi:hypothetical protein